MKSSKKATDSRKEKALQAIRRHLEALPKAELVRRLLQWAEANEDVRGDLATECRFEAEADSAAELVDWATRAIDEATRQGLDWGGNYDLVHKYLQQLLELGHADVVLRLGGRLFDRAARQVELSDEGLMHDDVVECLKVVFAALAKSSLSPFDQMCWVWDLEQRDTVDLCAEPAAAFWQQPMPAEAWGRFADHLQAKLEPPGKKKKSTLDSYAQRARETIVQKIRQCLEKAQRAGDIHQLLVQEAERTGKFAPLVDRLLEDGRVAEAVQWIRRGLQKLPKDGRSTEADQLRDRLCLLREKEKDWPAVAALRAEAFFLRPGGSTYQELKQACERLQLWPAVRAHVMVWLASPTTEVARNKPVRARLAAWPLPPTGNTILFPAVGRPWYDALIEIALLEGQPDEVLRWYDAKPVSSRRWGSVSEDRIADAVAASHPDRAIAIWLAIAESHTDALKARYDGAVRPLANIRRTLEAGGRSREWEATLAKFRQAHARQSRLLRLVDEMADKPLPKRRS